MIGLSIIALPSIWYFFDYEYPWLYFIPLGVIATAFGIGTYRAIMQSKKK